MAGPLEADVLQDDIAVSLARAVASANRRARELGVDALESLVSVTKHPLNGGMVWRINYGHRNYIGRRGGDLVIEVNPSDATIERVLRGQ